MVFADILT